MVDLRHEAWPTQLEALGVAEELGIDWDEVPFDPDQFRAGLRVERGRPRLECARVVLARLLDAPDHYRRQCDVSERPT